MQKLFKIYWPFALNEIKRNFAYKGQFYLYMLGKIFSSFITYYLWMAIYGSSESAILGGFTRNEMVIYVFMSYVVSGIISVSIAGEIGKNVVDGSIAMNLIKPIDYRISLLAKSFGIMIYRFVVPSLFMWIGLEIYCVSNLSVPIVGIGKTMLFLVSCFLSFLIYVLFDFCFGMVAFFTTYIFGMLVIKNAVLTFLTGQLIPLTFFPNAIQKVFDYLPFSSMNYVPVMIYLGKYSVNEVLFSLARQAVWVVLLYLFGSFIWGKITKRLVVLGG